MKKAFALIVLLGVAALSLQAHALAASRSSLLAPVYANAKLVKSGPYSVT